MLQRDGSHVVSESIVCFSLHPQFAPWLCEGRLEAADLSTQQPWRTLYLESIPSHSFPERIIPYRKRIAMHFVRDLTSKFET
jgi:hypothetical protein